MAGQTVFLNGGVLPEKGSSLFRVALVTEFVCGIRRDHLCPEPAMRIMAVGTFYLSFSDRMVRLLVLLGPDAQVADKAKIRLPCLEVLWGPRMDGVTVVAGNSRRPVPAHVPEVDEGGFTVAGETSRRFLFRIGQFLAEDKDSCASGPHFFQVGGSGSVAAFTAVFAGRRSGDCLFGMDGSCVAFVMLRMTGLAGGNTHGAVTAPCVTAHQEIDQKDQEREKEEGDKKFSHCALPLQNPQLRYVSCHFLLLSIYREIASSQAKA